MYYHSVKKLKPWTSEEMFQLLLLVMPAGEKVSPYVQSLTTEQLDIAAKALDRTPGAIKFMWHTFKAWRRGSEKIQIRFHLLFDEALQKYGDLILTPQNFSTNNTKDTSVCNTVKFETGDLVECSNYTDAGPNFWNKGYVYLYTTKNGKIVVQLKYSYDRCCVSPHETFKFTRKLKLVTKPISRAAMLKWLAKHNYEPNNTGDMHPPEHSNLPNFIHNFWYNWENPSLERISIMPPEWLTTEYISPEG